ncbi:methylase [Sulfurimicrobium lacus]|uniref:site-specific DNA-methyltransferase (adenine-specific) n=1 Tax=Sulfurimicrobium lacus TaxID=2715678 RepID=A0A6F8V973_9PROT|nr:class I SAM-dependent DNA methyltransferase [Sulfurimicrobium lacus]BCB26248.1 methylase [Sulfurimicrobium lacus]
MPLSWNEIKSRALGFSREWQNESSEDAEAKSFWDGFFNIFGISRKRIASFEEPVKKLGDKQGFIDLFWKGVLLVEHKSRGKNLDKAYTQALDYFPGISERDLPKYVLVSDFARFRLYDLETNEQHEFELHDLHKNVSLFGFIAGYQTHKIQEQDPVNIKAAERMGRLHDQMRETGFEGHPLELYLVRLLFCLFAEDTGIFERQQFQDYIEQRTCGDGTDLAYHISALFQVLNTPEQKRLKNLDQQLAAFPYVNGKLFEEALPMAGFDGAMRQSLLDCCALDWSRISPAIFGSLFQSIMDKQARRNLGAHYTSEKNILKLIKPLFLDALWAEFNKVKSNKNRLFEFHKKLRSLNFFDPACGCGNFLVIAYRELRLLELEVLRASRSSEQLTLDVHSLINLDVDQFYGIEIEEFPAQIAQVAMWLMDHQMNLLVSEEFGMYFARIPLKASANIVCGNALLLDWNEVVVAEKCSFMMGNPPFVGKHYQDKQQKMELVAVFAGLKAASDLDFVAAWYRKAADYMVANRSIRAALVSTNSITQGEQVGILWPDLYRRGVKIHFAHRTFQWNNEARGKAAVHCVIIGFALHDTGEKWLFEYEALRGEPHAVKVPNISPYLVSGPDIIAGKRQQPLGAVPDMRCGNKPSDGGNLLLSDAERDALLADEPAAAPWVRRFVGSEEFINNIPRWCLWLDGIPPETLRKLPKVLARVEAVRAFRSASSAEPTRRAAEMPTRFFYVSQPDKPYILIPEVSSERRRYVPIGFMTPDVISSNTNYLIAEPSLYLFGVLQSAMHMAWLGTVGGHLKSDFRYSGSMVYNTFPWPDLPSPPAPLPPAGEGSKSPSPVGGGGVGERGRIETAAQAVLDARAQFPDASLADLYDPLTMPPALLKAHQALDKAVDAAYGKTGFKSEAERVAFLFERYQKITSLLPSASSEKTRKTRRKGENA